MSTKNKLHDFYRNHAIYILIFLIMSLLSVAVMWHSHFITVGYDIHFHWQRIWDMRESLVHRKLFPLVALNQFNQTGSAVMALYPQLGMMPIVLLSLVIKSFIPLVYIVILLRNFFALLVAYFASYSYNKNRKISFIFASGYTLAATMLFHEVLSYDIGRSSSMIYLPMIMFGFLNLIEKNDWIELALGMSAIIMCHVVNTAIAILFLAIMFLININKFFDKNKIFALGKAIVLTVLLTTLYWIPFVIIVGNNAIDFPPPYWKVAGTDLNTWYTAIIQNSVGPYFNVINLLGLVLGIVFFMKLSKYSKQLVLVGIAFLFLCSNLFPWNLLANTGINDSLQFTWRLNIIPQVIFCYIFAEVIVKLFKKPVMAVVSIVVSTIVIVFLQLSAQESLVQSTKNNLELTHAFSKDRKEYRLNNNDDFRHLIFTSAGEIDYYPSAAVKQYGNTNRHIATYDGHKKLKVKLLGNGQFTFKNSVHINKMALPFLHYKGIAYEVKLDGKTVKTTHNKYALITLKNVSAGKHRVQIIVHRTKKELLSYFATLIGLIVLGWALIKKYGTKTKMNPKNN